MPQINIEYDDTKISKEEAIYLSNAIQSIVSLTTGIKDVFVYTNSAHIKVQIAPIEIFIRLSANIITENDNLLNNIKIQLRDWKEEIDFSHPINLTLIPMNWQIEIGI
ncbi:MAG: hypothetical protein ACLFPL_00925 [Candidatus Nanoarchaeia archaeon]